MRPIQIQKSENIEVMDREDYDRIKRKIEEVESKIPEEIDERLGSLYEKLERIEEALQNSNMKLEPKLCEIDERYANRTKR